MFENVAHKAHDDASAGVAAGVCDGQAANHIQFVEFDRAAIAKPAVSDLIP